MLTIDELITIMPHSVKRAPIFIDLINDTLEEFEIDTPFRAAMWLAQIAHESGELLYTVELASGANYEGRRDLGNVNMGDGIRYKGRGLIQLTGRANYRECGEQLEQPYEDEPTLLQEPEHATRSAGWFWYTRDLNPAADVQDIVTVTQRINGGQRGILMRREFYERALQVLN